MATGRMTTVTSSIGLPLGENMSALSGTPASAREVGGNSFIMKAILGSQISWLSTSKKNLGSGGDAWGSGGGGGWGQDSSWGAGDDGGKTAGAWGSDDVNEWAPNLDREINWHGVKLTPVTKDFYEEMPVVRRRQPNEVEAIRGMHSITVRTPNGDTPIPNPVTTFEEASFPIWLQQSMDRYFEDPTPIQIQGWPIALQGRDLVGIAETGSGKTLAYLAPMMVHIVAQAPVVIGEGPVGIVLAPTRELAIQINRVAEEFSGASNLKCTCVYGGVPVRDQAWALQEKNDIIVGTPGRLIHVLNERHTSLNRVTYVVLDEADEMLTKGFGEQIKLILSQVRPDRQMLMFSATWPPMVEALAREHCKEDPVMVRVGGDTLKACRDITQKVCVVDQSSQGNELFQKKMCKLVEALNKSGVWTEGSDQKALIFCRTKTNVDNVVESLKEQYNVQVEAMHSDKDQATRLWTLDEFKTGNLNILVATNCLGRGHDIKNVKFVINFDAPETIETYIHRIGRTGRAGQQGFSLTLLGYKDYSLAPDLIKVLEATTQNVPEGLTELAKGSMFESDWAIEQARGEDESWGGAWADGGNQQGEAASPAQDQWMQ